MRVLGWLVAIVYKALFLKGDTGFKQAHWVVKALHLTLVSMAILSGNPLVYTGAFTLFILLGLLSPGYEWAASTLILSSLISIYMSATALLASLAGVAPITLTDAVLIALKTASLSTMLAFSFIIISPLEISSLLIKLGAGRLAALPLLTWRLMPLGLKTFVESLQIGRVKGERVSARIPPAVAGLMEAGGFIEEYCFHRLSTGAKHPVLPYYSSKYTLILLAGDLAIALLLYYA